MSRSSVSTTPSALYHGSSNIRPKTPKHKGAGEDDFAHKTKPPIDLATKPSEFNAKLEAGKKAHRPGGSLRGNHPFGCSCMNHPCVCGTENSEPIHGHTTGTGSDTV